MEFYLYVFENSVFPPNKVIEVQNNIALNIFLRELPKKPTVVPIKDNIFAYFLTVQWSTRPALYHFCSLNNLFYSEKHNISKIRQIVNSQTININVPFLN